MFFSPLFEETSLIYFSGNATIFRGLDQQVRRQAREISDQLKQLLRYAGALRVTFTWALEWKFHFDPRRATIQRFLCRKAFSRYSTIGGFNLLEKKRERKEKGKNDFDIFHRTFRRLPQSGSSSHGNSGRQAKSHLIREHRVAFVCVCVCARAKLTR